MSKKVAAIILAAGQGKRMKSEVPKQYLKIGDRPLLTYALETFNHSLIDEIIIVVGKGEIDYCQKEIVEKYHIKKVSAIIEGGKERYHSVYEGIKRLKDTDYVYIHDGARPFVTERIIEEAYKQVQNSRACVVGMPVKDTIKIVNEEQMVQQTPNRNYVWQVQTPQVFSFELIKEAYEGLFQKEVYNITDDAMVVETVLNYPIKMIQGSYKNIKITTPEDLKIAENFLE